MLQPILVRVSPRQPELYEIAAGERRWRAAKLAGWTHCPAEIMPSCPDARMKRIALLENIQREQLTPLELAEVYDALLRETDASGTPVYTVRSLAETLKKNKDHIDEHRALLRVPADVRQLIEDDPDVPVRVVRELGNVEDVNDRTYLIEEVRARNLKTADIIAILQQRKRFQSMKPSPSLHDISEASQASLPQIEQTQALSTELAEEQAATTLLVPQTVTVIEHERSTKKPSSSLALVVLERKLHKDQMQLEKSIGRIADELPTLGEEEKA